MAVIADDTRAASPAARPAAPAARGLAARFKYPGLAMGLAVAASPLEAGLPSVIVALFVARAALPTWQRTLAKLRRRRGLDADLLDSLWVLFHTATGELIAPALAILLTETGNALRDATAMSGERRKPKIVRSRPYWIERKRRRRLVLVEHLQAGDQVLIGAGDRLPADGVVVHGEGALDSTRLTGASKPTMVRAGDTVYAGTVLVGGHIVFRVTRLGAQTWAETLGESVRSKLDQDTRIGNYVEAAGNRAVVPAIAASVVVFAASGDAGKALAPLQLDFAQGVGVGAPIPILAALQHAAANRVLIRGGHAVEQLARVDAVLFDKTGTLTQRNSEIVGVDAIDTASSPDEIVFWAASACHFVLQPFAVALVRYAKERRAAVEASEPSHQCDTGVVATVRGQVVIVGNRPFLRERGIAVDREYDRRHKGVIRNRSLRYVACGGRLLGALFYTNPLRPESATTIRALQTLGIRSYLITGDSSQVANAVAYTLGIRPGDTYAEASGERKAEVLARLQQRHRAIAYVGDGVNDAPALGAADVAVSFQHASDLARESADVVLLDDDLRGLGFAVVTARQAMQLVHQNIAAVTAANVAAVMGGVFWNLGAVPSVLLNNGSTVAAGINGLRPLLAGPRQDPEIREHTVRDEQGLLGVPWKKRRRATVGRLLRRGDRDVPA